MQIFLDPMITT